jgi:cell division septation protein DedD
MSENDQLALHVGTSSRTIGIAALSPGQWHDLQFRVVAAGDDSLIEVWVDGDLRLRTDRISANRQIAAFTIGDAHTDRTYSVLYDDVLADSSCIGTCSAELVTPTPVASSEPSPEPTVTAPPETPEPDPTATATPEPTETPTPEPTDTPTVEPTATPEPTEEPASDGQVDSESESDEPA